MGQFSLEESIGDLLKLEELSDNSVKTIYTTLRDRWAEKQLQLRVLKRYIDLKYRKLKEEPESSPDRPEDLNDLLTALKEMVEMTLDSEQKLHYLNQASWLL